MGTKIWDEMSYFLFVRGQVWSIDGFKKTKHVQRCQYFCVSCWALFLITLLLIDLIAWISSYRTSSWQLPVRGRPVSTLPALVRLGRNEMHPGSPAGTREVRTLENGASLVLLSHVTRLLRQGEAGEQGEEVVQPLSHVASTQSVLKCFVASNSFL